MAAHAAEIKNASKDPNVTLKKKKSYTLREKQRQRRQHLLDCPDKDFQPRDYETLIIRAFRSPSVTQIRGGERSNYLTDSFLCTLLPSCDQGNSALSHSAKTLTSCRSHRELHHVSASRLLPVDLTSVSLHPTSPSPFSLLPELAPELIPFVIKQ